MMSNSTDAQALLAHVWSVGRSGVFGHEYERWAGTWGPDRGSFPRHLPEHVIVKSVRGGMEADYWGFRSSSLPPGLGFVFRLNSYGVIQNVWLVSTESPTTDLKKSGAEILNGCRVRRGPWLDIWATERLVYFQECEQVRIRAETAHAIRRAQAVQEQIEAERAAYAAWGRNPADADRDRAIGTQADDANERRRLDDAREWDEKRIDCLMSFKG